MPIYETIFIVKPQLSDTEIAGLLEKTKKFISKEGGELLNEDKWGRRKLAYQIKQNREGFYVYLKYQAPTTLVDRLGHHFRVQDPILRALTLRQEIRKERPKKVKAKKP